MALRRICFGRAPNTWELPVVFVTALIMALISEARAFANSDARLKKGKDRFSYSM